MRTQTVALALAAFLVDNDLNVTEAERVNRRDLEPPLRVRDTLGAMLERQPVIQPVGSLALAGFRVFPLVQVESTLGQVVGRHRQGRRLVEFRPRRFFLQTH